MVYLILLSILGYCTLLIALKIYHAAEAPLAVVALMIGILYVCSLLGAMLIPAYVLLVGGCLSWVAAVIVARKGFKELVVELFQPGLVFFALAALILYPLARSVVVSSWDEFSHWGLLPKYLVLTDHLPVMGSVIKFYHYPPATAIFQYFIARLSGSSEGMIYYAHLLLLSSCMVVATKGIPWKKAGLVLLAILLPVVILLKHTVQSVFSLYTDTIMAFMAFAVFVSYLNSEGKPKDILKLIPILFVVPLIRESAATFAIFAIVLILVDQVVEHGFSFRLSKGKRKATRLLRTRLSIWFRDNRRVLLALALLLVVLLSTASWNLHVRIISPGSNAYETKVTLSQLFNDFVKDPWSQIRFMASFFEAGYQKVVGAAAHDFGGWSTPAGILLGLIMLMLVTTIMIYRHKNEYKKMRIFNVTLIIEFFVYMLGLLLVYMYRFTDLEAGNLAAYSRYMGSIVMFMLACFSAMLLNRGRHIKTPEWLPKALKGAALSICAFVILTSNPASFNILSSRVTEMGKRQEIIDRTKEAREIISMDDKVYQVWQGTQGEEYYTSRFTLMVPTNSWNWSLGQPYFDDDLWTASYTKKEWAQILLDDGYDYVFIGRGDRRLWATYGELFDQPNAGYTTYRVTPEGEHLLIACPESLAVSSTD